MSIRIDPLAFGYSELDWEYAKKKAEDPNITFEDVLKEKMDEIEECDFKNNGGNS